jgi:glycosyltransferase involved in cell wall biosynthesis
MPKLSVVLPVYNEESVLEKNVVDIWAFLSGQFGSDFELVVVDNGSSDSTLKKARGLSKEYDNIRCFHLEERGRGRALKSAWLSCDSRIVSYMDIDIATDLRAFPELIRAVENGSDIAIGSRWVPGAVVHRSFLRGVLSCGYNVLLKIVLGVGFSDAQCGFKAMKKAVLQELAADLNNDEWFFDTELLYKASRKGLTIKEVPVVWDERKDRKSKVNVFGTVFDYLFLIIKLRFE